MWPNPQFSADLFTFTGKILNGKLHFLCSAIGPELYVSAKLQHQKIRWNYGILRSDYNWPNANSKAIYQEWNIRIVHFHKYSKNVFFREKAHLDKITSINILILVSNDIIFREIYALHAQSIVIVSVFTQQVSVQATLFTRLNSTIETSYQYEKISSKLVTSY